jgi:hypothetical protein
MVAGIVALMKQASPSLTPAEIQAVLQATTSAPVSSIPNLWESCTRVDNLWECSGLSPARWPTRFYTGAGVVDASLAVQMAQSIAANSHVSGLNVTAMDSALSVDWANASIGNAPFGIYVDGRKVAESGGSQFTISGLMNDTAYSIQVVSSELVKTKPVLATPFTAVSIAAPGISNNWVSADSLLIHTEQPVTTAIGVLSLDNGDRAPCSQTIGSTFITCDYVMKTNAVTGQIRFVDEFGNLGNLSNQITWSSSLLPAPQGISVSVVSRTQVSASWSPVSSATSYCYYDAGQGAWITTSQTSAQITGVHPGLPRTFSVFASDESCRATGHYSPTYWYLAFAAPLVAPTNLMVQEINSDRLRISFTAPVGGDSYAVYRSDGKNWITGNADTYIEDRFSNSDQGRSFTYQITAIDSETYGSQYGDTSSGLRISVPRTVTGAPSTTAEVVLANPAIRVPVAATSTQVVVARTSYAAKSLAEQVGVTIISKKATVTFKVANSSRNICTISDTKLKTLKAGNCVVTFTVQEPKSIKGKLPKSKKTVKTLAVQ